MARTLFKDTWNGIYLIFYLMEYNLSLLKAQEYF